MLIKSIIKKEETIEKEVHLPYFCTYEENKFLKVNEDESIVHVIRNEGKGTNSVTHYPSNVFNSEITRSQEITESEFNQAYHSALMEIGKFVPDRFALMFDTPILSDQEIENYGEYVKEKLSMGERPLEFGNWIELEMEAKKEFDETK